MSVYAAVDIGSNSVRLAVAEAGPGGDYRLLASDREVTRIGESVFATGRVSERAIDESCRVLARFADACREWQPAATRAVATSALRDARNQKEFLSRAGEALGAPIQIISGAEEARLIHLGVLTRWPKKERSLLLLDIGGGSAEVTWSEKGNIRFTTSVPLGSVRLTQNFLGHDPPTPEEIAELEEYIEQQFAATLRAVGRRPKARAIGTSATVAAVVSAVNGIDRSDREQASGHRAKFAEIRRFCREIQTLDLGGRRGMAGIGPRRAEIIIAGAAVVRYFVERFTGGALHYSDAGLRDGVIADLAARGVAAEDYRLDAEQLAAVTGLSRRFGASTPHGRQVAALARQLFLGLAPLHRLPPGWARWLEAAAYLHDIGHFISSTRHHRHSYYVVAHADLPGFDDREKLLVANLCRYHRKALPDDDHENFRELDSQDRAGVRLLIPLLRLADGLDRGRRQLVTSISCQLRDGEALLAVTGRRGSELDLWGARQVAAAFREVYRTELKVAAARA